MGNYNPHAPLILGQEWVPIRNEDLIFSPNVNSVEIGTTYIQQTSRVISDGRFYTNRLEATGQYKQCGMINVYPSGTEDETGPINRVIIPVNAGAVTGTEITVYNGGVAGGTVANAVANPGFDDYILFAYNGGFVTPQTVDFFFAVNQYPHLAGKRILNVSLLYSGAVFNYDANAIPIPFVSPRPTIPLSIVRQMDDVGTYQNFTPPTFGSTNTGALDKLATSINNTQSSPAYAATVSTLDIGDVNNFWDPAQAPSSTDVRMPWRYVDLQRFEATAANRQKIWMRFQIPTFSNSVVGSYPAVWLDYVALQVTYCEEKRVLYGGKLFRYAYGMNQILLRDTSFNANPTLAAGNYLPTLSWVSPGEIDNGQALSGDFPILNSVRELYTIPSHPGVQVNVPFPLDDHLGETFTSETMHILPQLTLHASGSGTMTEPHVYGRQAAAQVFGTNKATQEIYDDITGVAASYPQVRYYARRFGDTTVPLMLTGTGVFTGSTVSITPADFDELTEILDGWREVTLRFINAPTLGAATGTPGWTWSANGETGGNRWEVLAASAPAISGIGGNLYNLVPSPNQLGVGTYQPPSGDTVELTWMPQGVASPWVSGATIDAATDAVLIFSQDPATVTGVALTARTQTVTGFALDCGALPCCIPTGIAYQQVSWSMPGLTTLVRDSFDRTVVNGMGSPDVGPASYTLSEAATAYQVNGDEARITPSAINIPAVATLSVGTDFDVRAEVGVVGNTIAGSSSRASLVGRYTDLNNQYIGLIQESSTGGMVIALQRTVGGVETVLVAPATLIAIDGGARVNVRFMGYTLGTNTYLKFKAWPLSDPEPITWDIEYTDPNASGPPTTGAGAGISARSGSIQGNTLAFENLLITPPAYWFGGYELQRYDSIAGDFDTIMLATDITQTSFNDYESRVGLTSVYRIRALNALNFAGQWSAYVSGAPPIPGVTGGCTDSTGALIFTSNADQTGASNAAYVMQWDNAPVEDFILPEADMVTYQPMYGRDGSVAFHGTERGLEMFDRTVLLHAAAIDPVRLADAKTIRDLAWADLPYICVRDEVGDRWFASVRVPTASARLNRTKYFARLEIVETTQTPYPVDP